MSLRNGPGATRSAVVGDAALAEPGDAELIAAVRSGDTAAYGLLYRRHSGSAQAFARQLTGSPADADDLVAEAFAKLLATLRAGGGPDTAFRAYLLTTLRHTLYDRTRRDRRLQLSDDMTRHDPGVPWQDTAVAGLESSLAARAFHRLPERWQTVLWHTEIERESPAQVAPLLGLTPNGVAALAFRAREGLRQAYLQEHLSGGSDDAHGATVGKLGAWARGGLSVRQRTRVDAHLATCGQCRQLADELADVNGSLRGVVAPLVLGTGAAAYLASHAGAGTTAAAAAGTAAGASAAASAAAGSAAAGGTAAGSTAAGASAAGATAASAGTGTAVGSAASWLVGTHAGQAVVAAVVAGTAAAGIALGSGGGSPPAAAPVATESVRTDRPVAAEERAGVPVDRSADAGAGAPRTTAPTGPPGSPGPSGRPAAPGRSAAPAAPGSPGAGPEPTAAPEPTRSAEPPGGSTLPALEAEAPSPRRPLRAGKPGELTVPVRNTGDGPATDLVATISLPPGFTVRAGGSAEPADGRCSGSGRVATCRIGTLAAGGTGALRVKVFLADDAATATVTGVLSAAGMPRQQIPAAVLPVEPR